MSENKLVGVLKCECCGEDVCDPYKIRLFAPNLNQSILYERVVCKNCYEYLKSVLTIAIKIGGNKK